MTTSPTLHYSSNPQPPAFAGLLLRPVGIPFYTLCLLLVGLYLWFALTPASMIAILIVGFFILIMAPYWLIRLLVALTLRRIYKQTSPPLLSFLLRYTWALLIPLTIAIVSTTECLQPLGLALARPAMDRLVSEIRTTEAARNPPATQPVRYPNRYLGPYNACDIRYFPETGAIHFYIEDTGLSNQYGYAHVPVPSTGPYLTHGAIPRKRIDAHWYQIWNY